jgi:hypothetical protein
MDNIANINTNPSSGYPKEEMMDNIAIINTNPSSGYHKEEMMDNIADYCPSFPLYDNQRRG